MLENLYDFLQGTFFFVTEFLQGSFNGLSSILVG